MSSLSARSPSPDSGASNSGDMRGRKRQRKERKKYSCEECRRLKLKCDREFPCQNCIKRECQNLCPDGVRPAVRVARKPTASVPPPSSREQELERLLAENGIVVPGTTAPSSNAQTHSDRRRSRAVQSPEPNPSPIDSGLLMDTPASSTSRLRDLSMPLAEPPRGLPAVAPPAPSAWTSAGPSSQRPTLPSSISQLSAARSNHPDAGFLFDDNHSSGTLMITAAGRSKYLGPMAGNEWLKDQEIDEPEDSLPMTRHASPEPNAEPRSSPPLESFRSTFPFGSSSRKSPSIGTLLKRLPPESQGRALLDSYFRYFAWSYDIVPRETLHRLFDRAYQQSMQPGSITPDTAVLFVHQLALVFVVLAMGALHHLELQPDDPMAEECLSAARACLTKGNFLVLNTVPGVQTLHLMAHVHLETEKGRNGDSAWPLWGLAMRMIEAMGIHRDGLRWNLPHDDVEERRRVFWDMQSADVLQANCFSRPNSIQLRYCDVQFPHDDVLVKSNGEEKGFHTLKYELVQLSAKILDLSLDLSHQTPSVEAVMELHAQLILFEQSIPYRLRCRAAYLALPSQYNTPEEASRSSPEVDRWNLQLTLQQHFLAHLITEALINLHRPLFVRALQFCPEDPVRSAYGASFLVVIERCSVLIQIAVSQHNIHPNVSSRHWFLWYHAFNSAVTLGTVILADPHSELAPFALGQIDQVVGIYTALVMRHPSQRMSQNLRWLMRLRQRAVDRIDSLGAGKKRSNHPSTSLDTEDAELLGWRTRLIERTSKGVRRATTIGSTMSPSNLTTPSPNTRLDQSISAALDQALQGPQSAAAEPERTEHNDTSIDQLLHDFWDPTTVLNITGENTTMNTLGWWDFEVPLDTSPGAAAS